MTDPIAAPLAKVDQEAMAAYHIAAPVGDAPMVSKPSAAASDLVYRGALEAEMRARAVETALYEGALDTERRRQTKLMRENEELRDLLREAQPPDPDEPCADGGCSWACRVKALLARKEGTLMTPDTRCPTCGGLAEPDTASNAITYWRSTERERALEFALEVCQSSASLSEAIQRLEAVPHG